MRPGSFAASAALSVVNVLFNLPAAAVDPDPGAYYVGAGYGLCTTDFKDSSRFEGSVDDEMHCASFLLGWDIGRSERFFFEVEYRDYEDTTFDGTFDGVSDTGNIEAETYGVFVGYAYPFGPNFSIGTRAGLVHESVSESEIFGGTPESRSSSGSEPSTGLKARYRPTPNLLIQAAWDRTFDLGEQNSTGEGDADAYTLSIAYRFGNVMHH